MPNMTITSRRSPFELDSFGTSHHSKLLASPIRSPFHPPTYSPTFHHDDTELLPDESAIDISTSSAYCAPATTSSATDASSSLPYDASLSGLAYIKSLLSTSPSPFATLTVLDISNRYIQDDGCALLCSVLPRYPTITTLNLSSNDLHSTSATHLASLLSHPSCTLSTLQLDWNSIAQPGPLLASLHTNTSLTHLDLRNNRITWEGGAALARCLSGNRTLQLVDLRWNAIGAVGGEALATALVYNNTIQNLLLDGNNITADSRAQCDEALRKNRALAQSAERDCERLGWAAGDRKRREVGFREVQDELWKATDELVRLQAEVRDRDARLLVQQERWEEREVRREREVRELENSVVERRELRAELERLERLLRAAEERKDRAEDEARQAKERTATALEDRKRLDTAGREDEERWRLMVKELRDEMSKLRLDVEDRERQVREIEERRRRDEENRNTTLHEQLRKVQRELDTVKRERDMREEELTSRIGAYKREKEAADERRAKEDEQWKAERRAWEDRCVAAELTARDEERRRREALQHELQLITSSRQELVEAMEAERRERREERDREREELATLKVRVIEAERDRERQSRACEEREEEVRRINDTLTGERIERQVALNELMHKHGDELRRLEDRWMKGEEERLRLQRRLDEVERERSRREQVLQSAMSALQVSMQQIDHASHMPTMLHTTTAAAVAAATELARPTTPAVAATVLLQPAAALPPAAAAVLSTPSFTPSEPNTPVASSPAPQPAGTAAVESVEPDRLTVPSPRAALTITVPPHSVQVAASASTPTAGRQPRTPTTPAASSASAILAALRSKPPPGAIGKHGRIASAPPRQRADERMPIEVEVEADDEWEREMEAEVTQSARPPTTPNRASAASKPAAGKRVVERVKEEEEEVEFSEEDVDMEEEEEKQPVSASSSRGSKVQTKGGVPIVRRY